MISSDYVQDFFAVLFIILGFAINRLKFNSNIKQIYPLILIFQGASIIILSLKIKIYLGIVMFLFGVYLLDQSLNKERSTFRGKGIEPLVLKLLNLNSDFVKYFKYIGFLIIIAISFSILFLFNKRLGDRDILGLFLGILWIFYEYVPRKYRYEREFFFLFINILFLFLVFPSIFFFFFPFESYDLIEISVTQPLSNLLSRLGYYVFSEGNQLFYVNNNTNQLTSVLIAPMCTGIYSIKVSISAIISYVLVVNRKLNYEVSVVVILGILTSYLSNILRLTMIILAGHYYGGDALYWSHQNLGWVIFTIWMAAFWYLLSWIYPLDQLYEKG